MSEHIHQDSEWFEKICANCDRILTDDDNIHTDPESGEDLCENCCPVCKPDSVWEEVECEICGSEFYRLKNDVNTTMCGGDVCAFAEMG